MFNKLITLLFFLGSFLYSFFVTNAIAAPNFEAIDLGAFHVENMNVNNSGTFEISNSGEIAAHISTTPYLNEATFFQNNTPTTLTSLGGSSSYGFGLNDNNIVVGHYRDSTSGYSKPYYYQNNQMINIPIFTGGNNGFAKDINSAGIVVGHSNHVSGNDAYVKAFSYNINTETLTELGTFGGIQSYAQAINENGQITGYAEYKVGIMEYDHAFIYDNGVMHDIGTLPGNNESQGADINEIGHVAGLASVGTNNHAILYANGVMNDLGTFTNNPAHSSYASGLNNLDQVVGMSDVESNQMKGFFYEDGVMHDLASLVTVSNGCSDYIPHDINDSGLIVGTASCSGEVRVVLLSPLDDDSDGTPNHLDMCPHDPNKTEPGSAGCGVAEPSLTPPATSAGVKVPIFNGWWLVLGLLSGIGLLRRRFQR